MRLLSALFTLLLLSAGAPAAYDGPTIRAQLRPVNHALVSAGIPGRIAEFSVKAGEKVSAGQMIARFDCREQEAELGIARTRVEASETQLKINRRLQALDNISNLDISKSEAELSIAQSQLEKARYIVSQCEMRAPFAGEIIEKHVQAHEHVREADPVFELIDTRNLEAEMVIPSARMLDFQPGDTFDIRIDEINATVSARVTRVVGSIDPVSQTVRVISELLENDDMLLPGMSGDIQPTASR